MRSSLGVSCQGNRPSPDAPIHEKMNNSASFALIFELVTDNDRSDMGAAGGGVVFMFLSFSSHFIRTCIFSFCKSQCTTSIQVLTYSTHYSFQQCNQYRSSIKGNKYANQNIIA